MESKDSSTIALIAGIIHLIFDVFFIGILFIFSGGMPFIGEPDAERVALGFFIGFIMLVMGIMFIVSSRWMKNPQTTRKGGITALILGILNVLTIFMIGWSIPGVMGIISGIMAIKASKK